jgi:putative chitinase
LVLLLLRKYLKRLIMNLSKLDSVIPKGVVDQIPQVMDKFGINTPNRLAHFLAQCAHESGGFKFMSENLNYSAKGLMGVFKKYFPTEAIAKQFERKPDAIADKVYGGRMGNTAPNHGSMYKGRGFIQLTGRTNYAAFDKIVDDDILANPNLVATKYPLLSAAWFWNSRNLNALADKGATDAVVTEITKKVNGGTHGLADRISKFKLFHKTLA